MSEPVPVHVIILAAGQGTRMRSKTPKVLHPLLGRPLVGHVIATARELRATSVALVVAPQHEQLRAALGAADLTFAVQDPPRGTGDAAACGLAALGKATGLVYVVNGDCPGLRAETLLAMRQAHGDAAGTFLSVQLDDPTGYGRIIRDADGALQRIVEEADCTPAQRAITEVNAGIYLFEVGALRRALARLRPDNAQGELYLTDTLAALRQEGAVVRLYRHDDAAEVHGVNTRAELARAETLLLSRVRARLMREGVTLRLPETISVDADVRIGADTVLYPGVTIEAGTVVGEGCVIHPHARIARSQLGAGVVVLDGSVIEDSVVHDGASIGPYARLRPGSEIGELARVGNFVETKKTRMGRSSKANHLSYLGDATIGEGVNVGAGTITCNYDGVAKHPTTIEDGAFIGSNTALVAPVRVGKGAYVGAGSTITRDVPDDALGVARGKQIVHEGWASRRAAKREKE